MIQSQGSIWRKWDLHIHSPFSYHWKGEKPNSSNEEALLREMVRAIEDADVAAVGIMDYWTFDGYLRLRDFLQQPDAPKCSKLILPGIELRLEAPVDYKLNTHVLFSDQITRQQLDDFRGDLKLGIVQRSLSREALIQLAKKFDDSKLDVHGFKPEDRDDEEKMFRLGCMTAKVTRDSWRDALKRLPKALRVVVQPYDTSDGVEGLDWKRHPYDDKRSHASC